MTKSHPAGGTRTLVGLISTFALVGGVVGFQNAASAEEAAVQQQASLGRSVGVAPARVAPTEAPVAEPAPVADPAPAPAPAPAPPSGTTGGSGG
jgi:hypothetical protein